MKITKDKYAFIYKNKSINSKFYISEYYIDVKIADFYPLSISIDDVFAFQISTPKLFFRTLKEIAEIYETNKNHKNSHTHTHTHSLSPPPTNTIFNGINNKSGRRGSFGNCCQLFVS